MTPLQKRLTWLPASERSFDVHALRERRGCFTGVAGAVTENFFNENSSSSTDSRSSATDSAASATSGGVAAKDESQVAAATGKNTSVTLQGGMTQHGSGNVYTAPGAVSGKNFTGATINVTNTDPALISDTFEQFAESQRDLIAAQTATGAENTGVLGDVLEKVVALSESSQTDGDAKRDTTIVYMVLGLAAAGLLALYFWRSQ